MKTKWQKRIRLAKTCYDQYSAIVGWRKGIGAHMTVGGTTHATWRTVHISTPKQARRLADALNHVAELMENDT